MPIESADWPSQLRPAYPDGSDAKSQGDDQIRLVKKVVYQAFTYVTGQITLTHTQINALIRSPLVPALETPFSFPSIAARANTLMVWGASGEVLTTYSVTLLTDAVNAGTAAAASAAQAATSASNAGTSETNSLASSNLAKQWATKPVGEVITGQGYSAAYYAGQAAAYRLPDFVLLDKGIV